MKEQGWDRRPNVHILQGRWQDVISDMKLYDGIFFDTYSEHYEHMQQFHALLPKLLKPGGMYSFFNGLAPRCRFFHAVYTRIVAEDLAQLGFECQYLELPVDVDNAAWAKEWAGVQTRYWFNRAYHLPIVYWKDEETHSGAACAPCIAWLACLVLQHLKPAHGGSYAVSCACKRLGIPSCLQA